MFDLDHVQVACDIAGAIGAIDLIEYAHRDITPWNIGHFNERGVLFDMSIAKVCLWGTSKGTEVVNKLAVKNLVVDL